MPGKLIGAEADATMRGYRRLIRYAWRQGPTLAVILALSLATSLATTLQPWPMKLLVDSALGDAEVPTQVQVLLAWLVLESTPGAIITIAALASLLVFMLNSALEVGLTWAWTAAGNKMVYDLAGDLFHKLQRLSLLFHSQRTVGDSLTRLTTDAWCVYKVSQALLIGPAQYTLTLATIGGVAWALDPGLAVLSLIVAPLLAAATVLFGHWLKRRTRLQRAAQSRLTSFVHQTLTAIPVVQTDGVEARNRGTFARLAAEMVELTRRDTLLKSGHGLVDGLAATIGTALILVFGGQQVLAGTLSFGSLLIFLAYLRSLQEAAGKLMNTYLELKIAEASIERVVEVLDADEQVREAATPIALPPRGRGRVQVERVVFGYEPGRPVLEDVDLDVEPGEIIALVGPTGAGKSTLASLIPRLLDPWSGRVLLDGVDVRQARISDVRARVALVLQEPFLLPLTVAENIAYGRPGVRQAEVEAAARAANAEAFIRQLPRGFDTILGERGSTLSGGQRQRLAIARALVKAAPILILDEPTSALDAESEALILEALERLMADRTTFVIAHRLSTVRRADRVIVLDSGRVVEQGSQSELLTRNGLYATLYALQVPVTPRGDVA